MRQRQQLVRERILADENPVGVQVLGIGEPALAEQVECLLHRIERIALAGEHAEFDQLVKRLGQRCRGGRRNIVDHVADAELLHRHLVEGQRPRLVDAEHGGRAQRLERRNPAGQDALLRDAPGAERQEDREHGRKLVRHDGHRQGEAGEEAVEPVGPGQPIGDHHEHAQSDTDQRQPAHQPAGFALQRAALGRHRLQGLADRADFGLRAGALNHRNALTVGDQRTGEDEGLTIAARAAHRRDAVPDRLAHRHRFSRQQRLVGGQVEARHHGAIGGDPVALGQDQGIPADHFAAGDAPPHAIADDQCARAREVA